ncbi:MAG: hypothetical protein ACLRXC_12080 [[Clostridium] leptum]
MVACGKGNLSSCEGSLPEIVSQKMNASKSSMAASRFCGWSKPVDLRSRALQAGFS